MPNHFFLNRSFESRLLFALGVITSIRILIGTLQDLMGEVSGLGMLIDYVLLCMFGGISFYSFHNKSFKSIHPVLGVILLFLIALLFIRSGGIEGTTEFNFFAFIVVLTLLFQGRWQKILLVLSFAVLIGLSYSIHVENAFFDYLFVRNSWGYDNFLFTLIILGILIFYLKKLIESEDTKLNAKNKELQTKVRLVRIKNVELTKKQLLLTQMNQQLLREIEERKTYHEQRTKALQQYIEQNTKKIQCPIRNLQEIIEQVDARYPRRYKEMLDTSMNDIFKVVERINHALHSEQGHTIFTLLSQNNEDKP